eukprot:6609785-Prymnesium_polylepis.1
MVVNRPRTEPQDRSAIRQQNSTATDPMATRAVEVEWQARAGGREAHGCGGIRGYHRNTCAFLSMCNTSVCSIPDPMQ